MAGLDYIASRHDEIRRDQSGRAKVLQLGVELNAYYGIGDHVIVLTVHARAMLIQGRSGTLYFKNEFGEGFVNAYGETYLRFCTQETQELAAEATPPSLLVELPA